MIAQYKPFPLRMSKEKRNEEEKIKLKTKPHSKTNSSLDDQTAGKITAKLQSAWLSSGHQLHLGRAAGAEQGA